MEKKLILFQKIYDFTLWLYPVINRIPRHHKTVLGRQIEELTVSMLLVVLSANRARGKKRAEFQLVISEDLDKLRILIRLTKDLRFMSIKQYVYSSEKVNEIGKILSGWMRATTDGHKVTAKPEPASPKKPVAKAPQNLTLFD
ncbi:MAG: hypothetical protein A3C27_00620 [Candidatus Levybacteria bacterium RIFCSPHIGHO2_02_FULL_39_36]|nr:MAG: hypothetical protein A3E11_01325 [Candidatus Curtissbacteria bacterium RIFCSPHIGHO2_12_FULL_38_37]OGH28318.1 MAG: hypothetical protein A3C27_00620 [Candidatus Levybacteria bacterium RIFCSPHIGHO2_02_FULL_39_36]